MIEPKRVPQKPTVIFTTHDWNLSGVTSVNIHLAAQLSKLSYPCEFIVTGNHDHLMPEVPLPQSVSIKQLHPPKTKPKYIPSQALFAKQWLYRSQKALLEYLSKKGTCVLIPGYDFRSAQLSAYMPSTVNIIATLHSDDPAYYQMLEKSGHYFDACPAVSQHIAETAEKKFPILAKKISTIHNGIPCEPSFDRKINLQAPLQLIYAGRLAQEQKRIFDFAPLLHSLEQQKIPFKMRFCGDGPERPSLQEQLANLTVNQKVEFLGNCSAPTLKSYYQQSDVLLMTSEYEGLSITLLEAMAQGCVPVVTQTKSGVSEVIEHGKNGFLLPIGKIDSFTETLTVLHQKRETLIACGKLAHETISAGTFRDSTMAKGYSNLIQTHLTTTHPTSDRLPTKDFDQSSISVTGDFIKSYFGRSH